MNKADINFSFRKTISPVKQRSQSISCVSFPNGFMQSEINLNNTSRFEEKKVLRKLREQEVLNRIESTFKRFAENDKLAKEVFKFKPVKKSKGQKEN